MQRGNGPEIGSMGKYEISVHKFKPLSSNYRLYFVQEKKKEGFWSGHREFLLGGGNGFIGIPNVDGYFEYICPRIVKDVSGSGTENLIGLYANARFVGRETR